MDEPTIWDELRRFDDLVKQFEQEMMKCAMPSEIRALRSTRELVAMGWPMVYQMIRRFFLTGHVQWSIPLREIVGTDPGLWEPASKRANAWVAWARSGPAEAPEKYREELRNLCTCSEEQLLMCGCVCQASRSERSLGQQLRIGLQRLQQRVDRIFVGDH